MSVRDLVGVGLAGTALWLLFRRSATTLPGDMLQAPLALPGGAGDPYGGVTFDFLQSDGGGNTTHLAPVQYDGAASDPADSSYDAGLIARESSGDPFAKNPRSSASGTYQFTKKTWQAVGGQWGPDPSQPFGGLAPSPSEQKMRFDMLTSRNASGLLSAGLAATNAALYAAHFLGLPTALRVLTAPATASLAQLVGSTVMKANPQLQGFTVADFKSWIGAQG